MSRIPAILLGAFLLASCSKAGAPAVAAAPPANSVELLKALERESGPRWKAKDVAFFENLFSDGFVWISTMDPAVQDRARYLADLRKDYTVEVTEIDEPTVIVSGTTAIAYGQAHNKGTFEGVPFDVRFWYHDTFAWDGKAWKCLATSSVPVRKPDVAEAAP